ncbi:homocysteine S-methyltransferase family protein [Thalassococcus profundi]|uniref:Homocysteine S-methyltransferase family protein n=1 Tax=Thalassococcus profundi TaxID=2282382 RepID=A0A369TTR5_9RHOB|nr:homocysteine S-methyltransferase family protein [Thalassococcus profundi]RDD66356.1 homocysteine S-methyltransferase family protein [Thalassococcus profundi]
MSDITLLDGGMGQELVKRAGDSPTPLWSTQVMLDHPGLVSQLHRDYFEAGATVASANTYAVHRDRLAPVGLEHRFEDLQAAALSEAVTARNAHGAGRVAGTIGPLGASYRPDLLPDHDTAVAAFAEIVRMMEGSADILLFETIASLDHARAALAAGRQSDLPIWLAVTVDDTDGSRLRSGEPVAEVVAIARDGAAAVLANCSAPEAMPAALDALMRSDLPCGAYANAFTRITEDFLKTRPTVAALDARRDMDPTTYARHVMGWVGQGATIVGGCCETGPAHIAAIARALRDAGHDLV